MRALTFVALIFAAALPGFAQTAADAGPGLPKDPRAIFEAAAPHYDFNSPDMKPWHLKATYQLYDEKGKPSEQGTYEYWWASPKVHRSTWTRAGATRTDWYTADGKHAYLATGKALNYFEEQLPSALLLPLPDAYYLDPAMFRLDDQSIKTKGGKIPCYMPVLKAANGNATPPLQRGQSPTYCFNAQTPVVVGIYSFGTLLTQFSDFVQTQGRVLPRKVDFRDGKRNAFTAKVELIDSMGLTGNALTPPSDAIAVSSEKVKHAPGIVVGKLIKHVDAEWPQEVGNGTVRMQATVGRDGHVHDLLVVTSTSSAIASAAMKAVSQWVYEPYKLNGEPVDAEEEIEVSVQQN